MAVVESALAVVLVAIAVQLPSPQLAEQQIDRVAGTADSTRKQVQLMHAQVDEVRRKDFPMLARQYRTHSEAATAGIQATAIDFSALHAMSQALTAAAKGLDGWADTLDARRYRPLAASLGALADLVEAPLPDYDVLIPRQLNGCSFFDRAAQNAVAVRDAQLTGSDSGFASLETSLQQTIATLDTIAQTSYPSITPMGLEMRPVWPDGNRVVAELRDAARTVKSVRQHAREATQLLTTLPQPLDLLPVMTVAVNLRQSQRQLNGTLNAWSELVETMQRSSAMLNVSRRQLDGIVARQSQYEQAMTQSRKLTRTAEEMLEASTAQFDARLAEQQHSLQQLDNGIRDFSEAVPAARATASNILSVGYLALMSIGGLLGVHALLLLAGAGRSMPV